MYVVLKSCDPRMARYMDSGDVQHHASEADHYGENGHDRGAQKEALTYTR